MKNVLVVKANNRPDGVSAKMFDTFGRKSRSNSSRCSYFLMFTHNQCLISDKHCSKHSEKLAQEQDLNQEEQN